jgi:hypothetical protein
VQRARHNNTLLEMLFALIFVAKAACREAKGVSPMHLVSAHIAAMANLVRACHEKNYNTINTLAQRTLWRLLLFDNSLLTYVMMGNSKCLHLALSAAHCCCH